MTITDPARRLTVTDAWRSRRTFILRILALYAACRVAVSYTHLTLPTN